MPPKIKKPNKQQLEKIYNDNRDALIPMVKKELEMDKTPIINFKYLEKCSVCCFKGLLELDNKKDVFEELQNFFMKADQCDNLNDLISKYGSAKAHTKIKANQNEFVNRVIKHFKSKYSSESGLVKDSLVHLHTHQNGGGSLLLYGTTYENIFYVLAFDPLHESC